MNALLSSQRIKPGAQPAPQVEVAQLATAFRQILSEAGLRAAHLAAINAPKRLTGMIVSDLLREHVAHMLPGVFQTEPDYFTPLHKAMDAAVDRGFDGWVIRSGATAGNLFEGEPGWLSRGLDLVLQDLLDAYAAGHGATPFSNRE